MEIINPLVFSLQARQFRLRRDRKIRLHRKKMPQYFSLALMPSAPLIADI
jgi:hypothetical protein